MKTYLDIPYGTTEGALVDLYLPDNAGFTTLLWFHGGGLETGSRRDGAALAEHAVQHGYGFASAEYRMYPDARFPEYIIDAASAVKFVSEHIARYGGTGKIAITGQSAGAYLTMMLYCNPAYLANAGVDMKRIVAFIADSAQQTAHFRVLGEGGIDMRAERIDEAAPLFYADRASCEKPLLLLWYKEDIPCRPEQSRLMLASLKRFHPNAEIQGTELSGGHCAGSTEADAGGEFPFIRELVRFLSCKG